MHTFKSIESKANELLEAYGVTTLPIPVKKIAKHLNLTIKVNDLGESASGLLMFKNNKGVIGISQTESEVRQRFTIAHEIGHFILHINKLEHLFIEKAEVHFRNSESSTGEKRIEIEANSFAASLLMPRHFIFSELQKISEVSMGETVIQRLSKRFNVSQIAMSIRLGNIGVVSGY